MKKLLFALLFINVWINAQNVHDLCKERGHIRGEITMTTSMYAKPYIIDTDSSTILVHPSCNYETFVCIRCGQQITQLEKEHREIIWQKEELSSYDSLFLYKGKNDIGKFKIKKIR